MSVGLTEPHGVHVTTGMTSYGSDDFYDDMTFMIVMVMRFTKLSQVKSLDSLDASRRFTIVTNH